jgi:hypothetical protein
MQLSVIKIYVIGCAPYNSVFFGELAPSENTIYIAALGMDSTSFVTATSKKLLLGQNESV